MERRTLKRRLNFRCWHCEREYSLTRELVGHPKLLVECPFCEHEAVVDLAPFRDETVEVYRSGAGLSEEMPTLNLPDVLPTAPRTDDA